MGLLLVTGDRGLAGGFNSQIIRAGVRAGTELDGAGPADRLVCHGPPRRLLADVPRPRAQRRYTGFTDKPSYADARAHRRAT